MIEESATDTIAFRRTLDRAWITLQRVERQGDDEQALGAGVYGSTKARPWKRHDQRDSSVKKKGRTKEEREERKAIRGSLRRESRFGCSCRRASRVAV